ncbi:hypothetical protein H8356DRAFT_1036660 [Neocallimastix lanati (nom. inval.)]|uniref:Uncharacterized protein n=1 Tax=Neocallimastix californiae TaxID=1754190 RepID=A0A1Y2B927_9FUNG|nr:hypothetical protein H8356DRAFT_1036660 [Neocallimastix sp. JGI-2020a]ORY31329.1 hypothetical protein LY90DRAFT_627134 [Neocallimastix californiae]|eukprot:ORY31329.1 hypothetical protein LY90DRAFT_627134 [Neocallimastix californiae]
MYLLIQYASRLEIKSISVIDRIQMILLSLIRSEFFPWILLIFILNKKNWKRPVIIILILHWLFRSVGDSLREIMELLPVPKDVKTLWPNTNTRWIVGNAIAHVFWLGGEMVGDWYFYIRTKAVTKSKIKINIVYICCIVYNIGKFIGIVRYFVYLPIDFNQVDKFKAFSQNAFMDKFKQISELRIFITMIVTLIFLPFIIAIVIFLINQYHDNVVTFVDPDPIRQIPLSIYYNLIYIDQILLKYFVQDDKTKDAVASNPNVIKMVNDTVIRINNNNNNFNEYDSLQSINHTHNLNKNNNYENYAIKNSQVYFNNIRNC